MKKISIIVALAISNTSAYCIENGCPPLGDPEGKDVKQMLCGEVTEFDRDGNLVPQETIFKTCVAEDQCNLKPKDGESTYFCR